MSRHRLEPSLEERKRRLDRDLKIATVVACAALGFGLAFLASVIL